MHETVLFSLLFLHLVFMQTAFIVSAQKPGLWVVYDVDDDNSQETTPHQQPPSCILARMKAKIDIFGKHQLPSSQYDLFPSPNETTATNYTCGSSIGEPEQKLILNWQPSSEIVFFFRQRNDTNFLHHVELRMTIPAEASSEKLEKNETMVAAAAGYEEEEEDANYVLHAESAWNLNMMSVPTLFAFVCHKPFKISMVAKVVKNSNDKLNDGGILCEACSAMLTLEDIQVEVFRVKRYYNDLTHLKYDCIVGWPYQWVSHTILCLGLLFALCISIDFTRKMMFKRTK